MAAEQWLTPIDELPEETRKIALKALQYREQNQEAMGQIERLGGAVDVLSARFEHFATALVHAGVITEQQLWEIHLDWERHLKPQLRMALQNTQAMIAAQQNRRRLIVPGQNGQG